MNKDMSRVKDKDIAPVNDKGQSHGFWELYGEDDSLWYKRYYHNGELMGYAEYYYGEIDELKIFYLN